jgi:hypothetical protein
LKPISTITISSPTRRMRPSTILLTSKSPPPPPPGSLANRPASSKSAVAVANISSISGSFSRVRMSARFTIVR